MSEQWTIYIDIDTVEESLSLAGEFTTEDEALNWILNESPIPMAAKADMLTDASMTAASKVRAEGKMFRMNQAGISLQEDLGGLVRGRLHYGLSDREFRSHVRELRKWPILVTLTGV